MRGAELILGGQAGIDHLLQSMSERLEVAGEGRIDANARAAVDDGARDFQQMGHRDGRTALRPGDGGETSDKRSCGQSCDNGELQLLAGGKERRADHEQKGREEAQQRRIHQRPDVVQK
jgi:hypothetical protein